MRNTTLLPSLLATAVGLCATVSGPPTARAEPQNDRAGALSATELETRDQKRTRTRREVTTLNTRGIRTFAQLATASQEQVQKVVGSERAQALIQRAKSVTSPISIIDPSYIVTSQFVGDPAFLVNPRFKTDRSTTLKIARAKAEVSKLGRLGIKTFRELVMRSYRAKLASVVGSTRATSLVAAANKASQAGFIEPQFIIDPSYLVDSSIIVAPNKTR